VTSCPPTLSRWLALRCWRLNQLPSKEGDVTHEAAAGRVLPGKRYIDTPGCFLSSGSCGRQLNSTRSGYDSAAAREGPSGTSNRGITERGDLYRLRPGWGVSPTLTPTRGLYGQMSGTDFQELPVGVLWYGCEREIRRTRLTRRTAFFDRWGCRPSLYSAVAVPGLYAGLLGEPTAAPLGPARLTAIV
jgi:hypothetical protein